MRLLNASWANQACHQLTSPARDHLVPGDWVLVTGLFRSSSTQYMAMGIRLKPCFHPQALYFRTSIFHWTPPNPTCSRWYDHERLKADYKPDSPPPPIRCVKCGQVHSTGIMVELCLGCERSAVIILGASNNMNKKCWNLRITDRLTLESAGKWSESWHITANPWCHISGLTCTWQAQSTYTPTPIHVCTVHTGTYS